jgi:hypothetical protein
MTASDVETATKTLNDLMDRKDELLARAGKLSTDRGKLAFAAHAGGNKDAKERLRRLNDDAVLCNCDLETIDAAIGEATSRLETARQAEALAADREAALQLRDKLSKFVELGLQADDALWDLAQSMNAMITALHELHQAGQAAPTSEQFRVNAVMAIKTMLQELPETWVRDFEFSRLAPGQRKRFKDICAGWQAQIEQAIAVRLGEQPKTTEAA